MINWDLAILQNVTEIQKWEYLRLVRNNLLTQTDWTQLTDAPVNKTAWAQYRQALRDLPKNNVQPEKITFPDQP